MYLYIHSHTRTHTTHTHPHILKCYLIIIIKQLLLLTQGALALDQFKSHLYEVYYLFYI